MLGLMRVLVSTSATIGGAATLLIRLCTLWFGLGLGVVALVIFRSTQRSDAGVLRLQEEEVREEQRANGNDILAIEGRSTDLHVASASSNTGDKVL
jgi:type IV secretory pathway TrbD component